MANWQYAISAQNGQEEGLFFLQKDRAIGHPALRTFRVGEVLSWSNSPKFHFPINQYITVNSSAGRCDLTVSNDMNNDVFDVFDVFDGQGAGVNLR